MKILCVTTSFAGTENRQAFSFEKKTLGRKKIYYNREKARETGALAEIRRIAKATWLSKAYAFLRTA